jgi:hypothetical protein
MYNPDQKQIIIKNSLGVSYHVFYESGHGLFLRMLGESRVWSRGYLLSELAVNDFSVILDRDDIFHFVFQTKDGQILYGHGRHGQIEIQLVLSSRDITPWPKHVSLLILKDLIIFFYMIRYKDRYLVSMQTIKKGSLSKPIAIDYVDGPDSHFLSFIDPSDTCHLIYTNSGSGETRLLHRIFNEDQGIFTSPEKLYATPDNILFLSAVCTENNQINLIFQVHDGNAYQALYKNFSDKQIEPMYNSTVPPGYTGLVRNNETLYFFRVCNQTIYFRSSRDQGRNWTDESRYFFGNGGALNCFIYLSYYKNERCKICSQGLPGSFSGGYKLAFINEQAPASKDLYSRNTNLSDIKLPGGINEAGSHSSGVQRGDPENNDNRNTPREDPVSKELQNKVLLLQNLTGNMERELTKLWLSQKEYEKKLDELSRSYKRLQSNISVLIECDNELREDYNAEMDDNYSVNEADGTLKDFNPQTCKND